MLAKRIIPCLDCDLSVPQGRVVKGTKFKNIRYAGVPWQLAKKYYRQGADEIVFLDITASHERRDTMTSVIKKTAQNVFVPLTVGGGINSLEAAREAFNAGADKVSVNTGALKNPKLITQISKHYGSQACVVAIDAKRRYEERAGKMTVNTPEGRCWFECSIYGGREFTGRDAVQWAREVERRGAGEILLTSMDRDGTNRGFDLELTKAVCNEVGIPVIASGGAGKPEHFVDVLKIADAALLAGILHYGKYTVQGIKKYLKTKKVQIR